MVIKINIVIILVTTHGVCDDVEIERCNIIHNSCVSDYCGYDVKDIKNDVSFVKKMMSALYLIRVLAILIYMICVIPMLLEMFLMAMPIYVSSLTRISQFMTLVLVTTLIACLC
jgi:hypothetical protein